MMQHALPQIQHVDCKKNMTQQSPASFGSQLECTSAWRFDNDSRVLNPEGFVQVEMP